MRSGELTVIYAFPDDLQVQDPVEVDGAEAQVLEIEADRVRVRMPDGSEVWLASR